MEPPNASEPLTSEGAKGASYPDLLIVEPKAAHKQTLILLHGRGDCGKGFGPALLRSHTTPAAPDLEPQTMADIFSNMKFIFPSAEQRHAKWYERTSLNQWFDDVPIDVQDIHGMTKNDARWQLEGLKESRAHAVDIIGEEVFVVGAANVFLGGLSQGCAMTLHALLSYDGFSNDSAPLGGYVGMSGWLPLVNDIEGFLQPLNAKTHSLEEHDTASWHLNNNSKPLSAAKVCNFVRDNMGLPPIKSSEPLCLKTPVYLGHGRSDERVKIGKGARAAQCLRDMGMTVV